VVNRAYYDWSALAALLVVLWGVAYQFSRRTYRLTVGVLAAVGVLAVTGYGLRLLGTHPTFERGLLTGANALSRDMLGAFIPAGLQHALLLGPAGWLLLLVLIGSVLLTFDAVSVRRQQPTVNVGSAPPSGGDTGDGNARGDGSSDSRGVNTRQVITEELKFRLPAVAVRSPASMPGGSALGSLATVVSDSGVQGSKLTAALMQAVHALEARPRIYEVQIFVDHCDDDGTVNPKGEKVLVTVDLRDARNGQTLATRILAPCPVNEAPERVAGFTARWVFRDDPSTPAWATGSYDGEDLSAYLLAQEIRSASRTYQAFADCRRRQRKILADAVWRSPNAGLVQYELAALDDLDSKTVHALRLHLDNRVHNPRFLPARYRLAVSLAALGGAVGDKWPADPPHDGGHADPADEPPALIREEIIKKLAWSGLLRTIRGRQFRALDLPSHGPHGAEARHKAITDLLLTAHPNHAQSRKISLVLLMLACQELRAYRRRMRASWLLWGALIHRQERTAYLELLRTGPNWRRHPRRRMATLRVALTGIKLALRCTTKNERAEQAVRATQARIRHQLGLDRVLDRGGRWVYGKLPWQAVYNAACLYAMTTPPAHNPSPSAAKDAVTLLRLAVTDPACELDRPSEWIGADPSLATLRGMPVFDAFVRERAQLDFEPAKSHPPNPSWFEALLPVSPPAASPSAAPPPAAHPPAEVDSHHPGRYAAIHWAIQALRRQLGP
jgi:hypothetical protein